MILMTMLSAVLAVSLFLMLRQRNKADEPIVVDPTVDVVDPEPENKPDPEPISYGANIAAVDEGYDIYELPSGSGYRYGPSIMYYEDGSLDAWFARPGNNSTHWDYISYRHCEPDGSWSDEEIVLYPTSGTMDHYSVCDPGLIYFNGYYYLGYTSANSALNGGVDNNGFVARSENPNGPFEKWDGEGWSDDPVPIVEYDGDPEQWGVGELSFAIKGDTLYVYYSWNDETGNYTRVATSDLSDNWPSKLEDHGVAYVHAKGEDSLDVAYIEEADIFLGVSVAFRFTQASQIVIYNSKDGIHFEEIDMIDRNITKYAHNIGISKDALGHIRSSDRLYISYAYGYDDYSKWGRWATRFQEIKLEVYEDR